MRFGPTSMFGDRVKGSGVGGGTTDGRAVENSTAAHEQAELGAAVVADAGDESSSDEEM